MKICTTTYPNPDIDGIACIVAYAEYLKCKMQKDATVIISGEIDNESKLALDLFKVRYPIKTDNFISADEIYLFDTHHLSQIEGLFDPLKVVQIIDHHPNGNPDIFGNAQITNELVGAAATVVTEQFFGMDYKIPSSHAGLLYCAIISNTLNFTAPTTTERDKNAINWLSTLVRIPDNLPKLLMEARSNFEDYSSKEIIERNTKRFDIYGRNISICQIEGVDVTNVILRDDFKSEVLSFKRRNKLEHIFVTAVDLYEKSTTFFSPNRSTTELISHALHLTFFNNISVVNKIMLRKSDLIPAILLYLNNK